MVGTANLANFLPPPPDSTALSASTSSFGSSNFRRMRDSIRLPKTERVGDFRIEATGTVATRELLSEAAPSLFPCDEISS
jgi:hypothetical protein